MHYVMSDIHGLYYEFLKMLEKIDFTDNDTLYIIGDVIDRGPFGIKLLDYIRENKNIVLIRGNHEQMMIDAFYAKQKKENNNNLDNTEIQELIEIYYDWLNNGGIYTLEEFNKKNKQEKINIIKYLENLDNFKILKINNQKYLLIHAGIYIPDNKNIIDDFFSDFVLQDDKDYISLKKLLEINIEKNYYLYIREDFLDSNEFLKDYIIIFGHTPTYYIPQYTGYVTKPLKAQLKKRCLNNKIYKTKYKIGIDCNGQNETKLGCLRLEDLKEFYINL